MKVIQSLLSTQNRHCEKKKRPWEQVSEYEENQNQQFNKYYYFGTRHEDLGSE